MLIFFIQWKMQKRDNEKAKLYCNGDELEFIYFLINFPVLRLPSNRLIKSIDELLLEKMLI